MRTAIRQTSTLLIAVLAWTLLGNSAPGKLSHDNRILHALNRLTYGAGPGDAEAVRKMGLKNWLDLQLHPERIPENPVLAERLAPLEALRLPQDELAKRYPNPMMIRAIAAGRAKLPDDPIARAAIERIEKRRAEQGEKGIAGEEKVSTDGPRLDEILSREQIRSLRTGSAEEKRTLLVGIPENKLADFALALPGSVRRDLMTVASPELRRKLQMLSAPQQMIGFDLGEGKLYRAIYSHRQLEEQLADFWYNHFNVFLDKGADRILVPDYEREAIRPHVLGRFRDLLEATARHPAMLFYLDNWQSVDPGAEMRGKAKRAARGLNENYARELMELHTLGVDGGYSQKDVTEIARCFTGWTIRLPRMGGGFFFNQRVHDNGEKIVLGVTIKAGGGQSDGLKVLDILARHPATAKFISKKLAQRFVADEPPQKLVDKMAESFRKNDGNIREVMKTMLNAEEFWTPDVYRVKVKSPFEMIASAIRATGAEATFAVPLINELAKLGQPLYRKLEPTGYSNQSGEWVNSAALVARLNFALSLAQNKVPGVTMDTGKFSADPAAAAHQLLGFDATKQTLDSIEAAWTKEDRKPGVLLGLLLGAPEFQRR